MRAAVDEEFRKRELGNRDRGRVRLSVFVLLLQASPIISYASYHPPAQHETSVLERSWAPPS